MAKHRLRFNPWSRKGSFLSYEGWLRSWQLCHFLIVHFLDPIGGLLASTAYDRVDGDLSMCIHATSFKYKLWT
jgi:hypothetical protein